MEKKPMKRTLTQKYDIHQLHALTDLENVFLKSLAEVYSIPDPDDLPVQVDVMEIFNLKQSERRAHLEDILKDAPGSCAAIVNSIISQMEELDAGASKKSEEAKA